MASTSYGCGALLSFSIFSTRSSEMTPPAVHPPLHGSVQDPLLPESTGFCFLSLMPFPWDLTAQCFFSIYTRWFGGRNYVTLEIEHSPCTIVFCILTYISCTNNSLSRLWTANCRFIRMLLRLSFLHGVIAKDSVNGISRKTESVIRFEKLHFPKHLFSELTPQLTPREF